MQHIRVDAVNAARAPGNLFGRLVSPEDSVEILYTFCKLPLSEIEVGHVTVLSVKSRQLSILVYLHRIVDLRYTPLKRGRRRLGNLVTPL